MTPLLAVKETCLYVDDLSRAEAFYAALFGLTRMGGDDRFCAFDVGGRHVLLLFKRGASNQPNPLPDGGGVIPPHDGAGPAHIGFSIEAEALGTWEARLEQHGVATESRVQWPRGGTSIFFRDPDGHLLELLTPGVWPTY